MLLACNACERELAYLRGVLRGLGVVDEKLLRDLAGKVKCDRHRRK